MHFSNLEKMIIYKVLCWEIDGNIPMSVLGNSFHNLNFSVPEGFSMSVFGKPLNNSNFCLPKCVNINSDSYIFVFSKTFFFNSKNSLIFRHFRILLLSFAFTYDNTYCSIENPNQNKCLTLALEQSSSHRTPVSKSLFAKGRVPVTVDTCYNWQAKNWVWFNVMIACV